MRILIANGVNLDLLGRREPDVYGSRTLADLEAYLLGLLPPLAKCLGLHTPSCIFFQSNDEASFMAKLDEGWHGALINPGAWTHTSLALADRLAGLRLPFIEVHLSHLSQREAIRQHSYCAPHALGVVSGLGFDSYAAGLMGLLTHLKKTP